MQDATREVLSWDEIRRRHPDEWVALEEADWPDTEPHPRQGVVIAHHPVRKQFWALLPRGPHPTRAFDFTGERQIIPPWVFWRVDSEDCRTGSLTVGP